ncbi:MAG: MarR family transcriptional regulator [Rhodobacteraceae bacterium]|nr:MarR family transcriptional regulator [Paracoccaceae bacterium]PHR55404.1 MAG: MarR family transcriptional regulator [Robiginitomaculum sp.]
MQDASQDDFTGEVSDETLRQLVGYNIKRTFNAVQADLARVLAPFDLRMMTYSALVLIVDNPSLRQSHLADALAVERPNLVIIIDELERRGLISRERLASDRRAYALVPTLPGRQLYEKAVRAVCAHETHIFGALDDPETLKLVAALRRFEQRARRR